MNNERNFDILPPARRDFTQASGIIQESEIWARRLPAEAQPSMAVEYARTFWNHRWLVIGSVAAGCLVAFACTVASLPVFRAHTSVEIQGINANFMNFRSVEPTEQQPNSSDESFVQTQIKLLQSESLVSEVLKKMNSAGGNTVPRLDLLSIWQRSAGKSVPADLSRKSALQYIAENLKVKPMGMTRLVEVSCSGWDAQLAADFCNTLTQQFIDDGLNARLEGAQKTSKWLTDQVADIREKLARSEDKLQAMKRENAIYTSDNNETIAQTKLRQLQDEASRAEAERINKYTQYQLTTSAPADTLPMVLDNGPLKEYQMNKTALQRELAKLSPPLLPTHPEVKKLVAQIAQIDSAIQKERTNIIARAKNEYSSSVQRAQLINEQFAAQQRVVDAQLQRKAQIDMLDSDVKSTRQLYEGLLERAKEAGFATALHASSVRVVDPAKTPLIPISPRRTVATAAGGAIAALLSLMFALVRQRNDPRLRTPEEIRRDLKIRDVAVIPSVRADRRLRGGMLEKLKRPQRGKFDLTTWTNRDSLLAEAYRVAINSIFIARRRLHKAAVLVVSSPSVGEGKTTATANLAIALAETRKRVVVVDGDLRNPRLHKSFNVNNGFGLRDALRMEGRLTEEMLQKIVKPTEIPGVSLVPSGARYDEDSISQLHSPNLPVLIKTLSLKFDVVLIDTPPMLNLADARVFCESADGAILVVRADSTTREMAAIAYDGFATVNTPVIGVLLNDFDARRNAGYGYYKKYYEYYRPAKA